MLALRSVSSVRGVPALSPTRARARAPGGSSSRRVSGRHSVRICANVSGLPDVAEGQWPIGRTLRERSPSQILNNFVSGVRPGAFRRENELFSGRIAMLGFLAAVVNEAQTGKGILEQLNAETGASVILEEDLLLFQIGIILVLAFTGITTGGQPWQDLVNKDGKDAQVYTIKEDGLLKYFIQVLGLNTDGPVFGANANNELFLGRLAMIGFAVSTFLDALGPDRGLGPLAQLGLETGPEALGIEEFLTANAVFFFLAALYPVVNMPKDGSTARKAAPKKAPKKKIAAPAKKKLFGR
ncbi:photosystem II 22kDa protein [Pycnococcus provasolii]